MTEEEDALTDERFNVIAFNGQVAHIVAVDEVHSICRYMSDCADVSGNYTDEELQSFLSNTKKIPAIANFSHNAEARTHGAKVFVFATRNISRGDEIFYSYSRCFYWLVNIPSSYHPPDNIVKLLCCLVSATIGFLASKH